MGTTKKLRNIHIFTYCVIFYSVWSLVEFLLDPMLESILYGMHFEIVHSIIKLLIWTVPAVWLIRRFKADLCLSLKEMLTNKINWTSFFSILAGVAVYLIVGCYFRLGQIAIHPKFDPLSVISVVIFVGITEEFVFRGWLLNLMLKKMSEWSAVLISSILFTLIHFPIWIITGQFTSLMVVFSNCLTVTVLGIGFSWSFIKSKNIFVPIAIHMIWNLLTIMLYGS